MLQASVSPNGPELARGLGLPAPAQRAVSLILTRTTGEQNSSPAPDSPAHQIPPVTASSQGQPLAPGSLRVAARFHWGCRQPGVTAFSPPYCRSQIQAPQILRGLVPPAGTSRGCQQHRKEVPWGEWRGRWLVETGTAPSSLTPGTRGQWANRGEPLGGCLGLLGSEGPQEGRGRLQERASQLGPGVLSVSTPPRI